MSSFWHGVLPAITTAFDERLAVDHSLVAEHCERMLAAGCLGVIPTGSLGEGATLSADEKVELVRTCVDTIGDRGAVVPGIASLSTADGVSLATRAAEVGAAGLMVLPPYAYSTDWREMRAHVRDVIAATELPCILYNNPVAYGTDFLPEQIAELADELPNLEAVKESSTDVRRVTELKRLLDDRLAILVGVDDLIVEGVGAGADGWVAGLVNAFPEESVRLFELAQDSESASARRLYEWFLPLLRLDTVPKLVQLIKLVQELTGQGPARVRPPRLDLSPEERADTTVIVEAALASRAAA